ncbi:hypothetical protein ACOMHN_005072 [Nucella lapillus]
MLHINSWIRCLCSLFIAEATSSNNCLVIGCLQDQLLRKESCEVCFVFLMGEEVVPLGWERDIFAFNHPSDCNCAFFAPISGSSFDGKLIVPVKQNVNSLEVCSAPKNSFNEDVCQVSKCHCCLWFSNGIDQCLAINDECGFLFQICCF